MQRLVECPACGSPRNIAAILDDLLHELEKTIIHDTEFGRDFRFNDGVYNSILLVRKYFPAATQKQSHPSWEEEDQN